jgi:hypothetical protein
MFELYNFLTYFHKPLLPSWHPFWDHIFINLKIMKKYITLAMLFLCFSLGISAQTLTRAKKQHMIDSAFDARIDRYLRRCFPEFTIEVQYEKDSFSLCSIETVLLVAANISADQTPLLEKYMVTMANYYVSHKEFVHFDYGIIPVDVDANYDRMFHNKLIYVGSPFGAENHPKVNYLFSVFNKVTDHYLNHSAAAGHHME